MEGGNKAFVNKLDSVFSAQPIFAKKNFHGGVIHEMREMQVTDMGQYAHGNQPIQHMIYLYDYAGAPWKTQFWARKVMNKLYKATPDGYCGDEDNGQTSAWYVFSAMGFYPVCPVSGQYVIGAPLFKKLTISLENGKTIVINAPVNNDDNKYINRITYNGKLFDKNWFDHKDLLKGAVINFDMSSIPNKLRATAAVDYPFSLSNEK